MKERNKIYRLGRYSALAIFILIALFFMKTESAYADFSYKNLETGTTVTYSGKVPKYTVNGKLIDTSEAPAIINSANTAMGSAEHIFGSIAGVDVEIDYSQNSVTISCCENTLVLYIGMTRGYLNGESVYVGNAPMKIRYSSSGATAILVPTRFVSEKIGLSYEWDSSSNTAKIKVPLILYYNLRPQFYTGSTGKVSFNGSLIENTKDHPVYIINSIAMLEAKHVFNGIPGMTFSYNKRTREIKVTYGELELKMKIDSYEYELNGVIRSAFYSPMVIKNYSTGKSHVYVPGQLVFEMLGFNYKWDSSSATSKITSTSASGKYNPDYELIGIVPVNSENNGEKFTRSVVKKIKKSLGEYAADESNWSEYHTNLAIPFPDTVKVSKVKVDYNFHFHRISIDLSGDYREFYKNASINNPGVAVRQLQLLYYPKDNVTRIVIYTIAGDNESILGAVETRLSNEIVFTIDKPKALHEKIIVLDAGHGGFDPGSCRKGYSEKNINYSIINRYCREYFDSSDVFVYYTRNDDSYVPLFARATFAGKLGADLFISVHQNADSGSSARGTGVYFCNRNTGIFTYGKNGKKAVLTSRQLAQTMQDNLVAALGSRNYGVWQQSFSVISEQNTVPAILIEVGFMSNSTELSNLVSSSYQKKVAKTLFDTVELFYQK